MSGIEEAADKVDKAAKKAMGPAHEDLHRTGGYHENYAKGEALLAAGGLHREVTEDGHMVVTDSPAGGTGPGEGGTYSASGNVPGVGNPGLSAPGKTAPGSGRLVEDESGRVIDDFEPGEKRMNEVGGLIDAGAGRVVPHLRDQHATADNPGRTHRGPHSDADPVDERDDRRKH